MRKKQVFLLLPLLIFFQSCLVVKAFKFEITFSDQYKEGKVIITSEDIRSQISAFPWFKGTPDESITEERIRKMTCSDFKGLVEYTRDNELLFDMMKCGIYVQHRGLMEKEGMLNGEITGIFKNLSFDDEGELTVQDSIIVLNMDEDDNVVRIESDGEIKKDSLRVTVTWKKQKHIWWKVVYTDAYGENIYSLLEAYRHWKNKNLQDLCN